MRTDELDYFLPPHLIAREPARPRDHSRLMVYRRATDRTEHRRFYELPELLEPGDLLIANDTRVLPAKLILRKASGGLITGLFLSEAAPRRWRILLRSRGRVSSGMVLAAIARPQPAPVAQTVELVLCERLSEKGQWIAQLNTDQPAPQVLARIGCIPLPPYIEKARAADWPGRGGTATVLHPDDGLPLPPFGVSEVRQPAEPAITRGRPAVRREAAPTLARPLIAERPTDATDYQTVYAQAVGALAAPTAGLHFTPQLLEQLRLRRLEPAFLTLHVGLGTFLPVSTARLEDHPMHGEWFTVRSTLVDQLRRQRAAGRRIVAVGTTTVRALETAADTILNPAVSVQDITAISELFIQPGFHFQLTDALITNFHLPRSTLLALVAALVGLPRLKALYQQAVRSGYRFYSFGDAMLILP